LTCYLISAAIIFDLYMRVAFRHAIAAGWAKGTSLAR
jgi:hypothetical protein